MSLFTNGFNVYLDPLVQVDGATSISIVSLVDVEVGSFSSKKYVSTPWRKQTKTTIKGAHSLENPSCSKLDFSHPSLVVAVVVAVTAALPSLALRRCRPASCAAKLTPRLAAWLPAGPTGRPCPAFINVRL